jgi:hypothetical protein
MTTLKRKIKNATTVPATKARVAKRTAKVAPPKAKSAATLAAAQAPVVDSRTPGSQRISIAFSPGFKPKPYQGFAPALLARFFAITARDYVYQRSD